MSLLSVNFTNLNTVVMSLGLIETSFDNRISTISSTKDALAVITDEFGYLSSAKFQLQLKLNELENDKGKITAFKTAVSDFIDFAEKEETGLAERLYSHSDDFMEEMGITPEYEKSDFEKFCEDVVEVVTGVVDAVVDMTIAIGEFVVENWDVIMDVIGEVLIAAAAIALLVGAIASGAGIVAIIALGWGAFKATTELMGDAAALGYLIEGDEESAEYAADYDAKVMFEEAGEFFNDTLGVEFADEIFDGAYITLDTVELIYSITSGSKTPAEIDFVKNVGETISDIPEDGVFAFSNMFSDEPSIGEQIFEYLEDPMDIVNDNFVDYGWMDAETSETLGNIYEFSSDTYDLVTDFATMDSVFSNDGVYSNFENFLMYEGIFHSVINDVSEAQKE